MTEQGKMTAAWSVTAYKKDINAIAKFGPSNV
jgi:hypothetical protein